MSEYTDLEWIIIDATPIRAHQHTTGPKNQAIGHSNGGLCTKIHTRIDALGNPTGFILLMSRPMT